MSQLATKAETSSMQNNVSNYRDVQDPSLK
jgi:hypothetical protein